MGDCEPVMLLRWGSTPFLMWFMLVAIIASLREMEKKINKDMDDLLITDASAKKLTVNTLFERYMATKNIKERTKKNYIRMWDYRIRNTLGNIRVVDFKTSHVRTFFSSLSDEGLAHSTIKSLYGLLNPSFEMAVEYLGRMRKIG